MKKFEIIHALCVSNQFIREYHQAHDPSQAMDRLSKGWSVFVADQDEKLYVLS